jgi:hypothetical protein
MYAHIDGSHQPSIDLLEDLVKVDAGKRLEDSLTSSWPRVPFSCKELGHEA